MNTKLAVAPVKSSNIKSISAVVAPVAVVEPVFETIASAEEGEKRQRTAYEPKSVTEMETDITKIAEVLRAFKTRLYPTSNPKANAENAPTRREIDDVITKVKSINRDYKAAHRLATNKPRRKTTTTATGKARPGGFKNPCLVSDKLASFIATHYNTSDMDVIDDSKICTRALLTSMLTQYAYDNNRRDPNSPTKVIPDAAMTALFEDDFEPAGVDPKGFPHTHMQKLLTRHVAKTDDFKSFIAKQDASFNLETYKNHLEAVQENFKSRKAAREASKPKPKKVKKVEEPSEVAESAQ